MLRLVFAANVIVAGVVGVSALFGPQSAGRAVFSGTEAAGPAMAVTGAFWCAIALVSVAGVVWPERMAPVLVVQVLYKGLWLAAFALPAWRAGRPFPVGVALFFAVWVLVLPLVIPWRTLLAPAP